MYNQTRGNYHHLVYGPQNCISSNKGGNTTQPRKGQAKVQNSWKASNLKYISYIWREVIGDARMMDRLNQDKLPGKGTSYFEM